MTSTSTPTRFLEEGSSLPVSLPAELLAAPIVGRRLALQAGGEASFGAQLGPRPDALVFLRHFG